MTGTGTCYDDLAQFQRILLQFEVGSCTFACGHHHFYLLRLIACKGSDNGLLPDREVRHFVVAGGITLCLQVGTLDLDYCMGKVLSTLLCFHVTEQHRIGALCHGCDSAHDGNEKY